MATPRNRLIQKWWPGQANVYRRYYRSQNGWNGNHVEVLSYIGLEETAYNRQRGANGSYWNMDAGNAASGHEFLSHDGIPPWSQPAYNACYAGFREKVVGEQSQLGAAVATWKQSASMIKTRGTQLYRGASALRKGNFKKFLSEFGLKPKRRHRNSSDRLPDAASGLWLEYSYGWSPLVQDIYNSMTEMEADIPVGRFHKRKGCAFSDSTWGGPWADHTYTREQYLYHQIVADVRLVNPNRFLTNQLGIDNPVTIGWEVVPFSFCVDWFVDLGSWFESFTDFAGLSIENACSTSLTRYEDTWVQHDPWYQPGVPTTSGVAMVRRAEIPSPLPNLQFKQNLGGSLSRAANAVSLLTQVLIGLK